jgi:hypothetical protein
VDARHACMAHRNAAECPATAHVHYELSSKTHSAQFPQLVPQTLRPIPARISHRCPPLPTPAALAGSATANLEQLAREYNETIAFIGKQLKKDPRLNRSQETCSSTLSIHG